MFIATYQWIEYDNTIKPLILNCDMIRSFESAAKRKGGPKGSTMAYYSNDEWIILAEPLERIFAKMTQPLVW